MDLSQVLEYGPWAAVFLGFLWVVRLYSNHLLNRNKYLTDSLVKMANHQSELFAEVKTALSEQTVSNNRLIELIERKLN